MGLVFKGREGVKKILDENGETIEKPSQQFKSGVMIVDKIYKFTPRDIGKVFSFENEDDILKRYPHMFRKA